MNEQHSTARTPTVDQSELDAQTTERRFVRAWRFALGVLGLTIVQQVFALGWGAMHNDLSIWGTVQAVVMVVAFVRLWGRTVPGARLTYFVFLFFGAFRVLILAVFLLGLGPWGQPVMTTWELSMTLSKATLIPLLGFVAAFWMSRVDFTMHCHN